MADESTNAGEALPDNASVDDAVELMVGLADGHSEEGETQPEPASEPEPEPEAGQEQEPETDAPEFWSAEDKAAWVQVPVELRPVLKKYEQQRIEFANQKAREAAQFRDAVAAELKRATDTVDEAASWWQQAGPALQRAFADKWAQVSWAELAEKNPAEWARLNQLRMDEAALLAEAQRRGQADIEAAHQRTEAAFQAARQSEHAKLAAKHPEYFGTADRATATYKELGEFLLSRGIPVERINNIYEAPIIELALMAMRFDRARHKASPALNGGTRTTGNATPTRVQPGPARQTGNRTSEAARQVGERFRRTGEVGDAAELIHRLGL